MRGGLWETTPPLLRFLLDCSSRRRVHGTEKRVGLWRATKPASHGPVNVYKSPPPSLNVSCDQIYPSCSCFDTRIMSTCDTCDCADKSQCVKKGNGYGIEIIETGKSYFNNVVDAPAAAENEGKCKCGDTCACVDCKCST